jgi:hypothetical protein
MAPQADPREEVRTPPVAPNSSSVAAASPQGGRQSVLMNQINDEQATQPLQSAETLLLPSTGGGEDGPSAQQ